MIPVIEIFLALVIMFVSFTAMSLGILMAIWDDSKNSWKSVIGVTWSVVWAIGTVVFITQFVQGRIVF